MGIFLNCIIKYKNRILFLLFNLIFIKVDKGRLISQNFSKIIVVAQTIEIV